MTRSLLVIGPAAALSLLFLLLGGFMLSTAMADSGAHRRIALYMVNLFGGGNARGLVLGFMAAAVALAVLEQTEKKIQVIPAS